MCGYVSVLACIVQPQGVSVGLFCTLYRAYAVKACNKLSVCRVCSFTRLLFALPPPPPPPQTQGVGVGLFRDRACAVEACNKLSGAQADGRKLELVLMNPDNHVSFSCRQVGGLAANLGVDQALGGVMQAL
jgi:hypothetical protein